MIGGRHGTVDPSCSRGFESQTQHLRFFSLYSWKLYHIWYWIVNKQDVYLHHTAFQDENKFFWTRYLLKCILLSSLGSVQLWYKASYLWGRGGGQVVSVLAFYFNNPRLNPSEADNFYLKRTKKRQQEFRKRRFKSVLILLYKKLR